MVSTPLSADAIVATALQIASEDAFEAVTLGRVARDLGCHVTSLYSHIDSIDDLRVRMALSVQDELTRQLWLAALGRSGTDALRALGEVYRAFGRHQPAHIRVLFAMTGTTDARFRDGAVQLAEPVRATLRGFGLDDAQVRHAHRAFGAAMRGFLLTEAQGMYGDDADATFDQLLALFATALTERTWPAVPAGATTT